MSKRVRIILYLSGAVLIVLLGLFAFPHIKGHASLVSKLPLPSASAPYVLVEASQDEYPLPLAALLTDGQFALLRKGSPGERILSITNRSRECAFLIESDDGGALRVSAALRLSAEESSSLKGNELPRSWRAALGASDLKMNAENGIWEIRSEKSGQSLFCARHKRTALLSDSRESLDRLLDVSAGRKKRISANKWKDEKKWQGHIEVSDGGLFLSGDERKDPIVLQAAWRSSLPDERTGRAGSAKWRISGLEKRIPSEFINSLSAKKWNTSNFLIPEPLLLSVGVNIPKLSGSPSEWPFPLDTVGELGQAMGLKEKQIKDALAGETTFSVGGHNKLLWFTLPGLMAEFTGERELIKELVDAFWKKLFFGAEPQKMDGFDYGGSAAVPFSVVGAGRENMAIFGLLSPNSIKKTTGLEKFLKDDEKVIAWMIADLPKIGIALGDMTKMNAFMRETGDDGESPYGDDMDNFLQPDQSFSPFDQGISDSFGRVLEKMSRIFIVWETTGSGRIDWF